MSDFDHFHIELAPCLKNFTHIYLVCTLILTVREKSEKSLNGISSPSGSSLSLCVCVCITSFPKRVKAGAKKTGEKVHFS